MAVVVAGRELVFAAMVNLLLLTGSFIKSLVNSDDGEIVRGLLVLGQDDHAVGHEQRLLPYGLLLYLPLTACRVELATGDMSLTTERSSPTHGEGEVMIDPLPHPPWLHPSTLGDQNSTPNSRVF